MLDNHEMKDLTFKKRDEFNRKPIAQNIIKLLKTGLDISPLIVEGYWGSGKTEFCFKLINLIKEQEENSSSDASNNKPLKTIYIDAFREDYADNPLMTIISAILAELEKNGESEENKDLQNNIKETVIPLIKLSGKITLNALSGWILQQDGNIITEDIKDILNKANDQWLSEMLDTHIHANETLENLRNSLKELGEKNTYIIFIDELDRCRPDFAISMLEVIKHVFNVSESIKFVLVTNTKQLEASIAHRYGNLDAKKYLDKFIRFRFELPNFISRSTPIHELENIAQSHFLKLANGSAYLKDSILVDHKMINNFIDSFDYSLRDIEKLIKNFEIYQVMTDNKLNNLDGPYSATSLQIILAIILFTDNPVFCYKLIKDQFSKEQLVEALGLEEIPNNFDERSESKMFVNLFFYVISFYQDYKENIGFKGDSEYQSQVDDEMQKALDFYQRMSKLGIDNHLLISGLKRTLLIMGMSI